MLALWKKNYKQSRQHIKKQRHYFTYKGLSSQSCGFSSSHIGCESWTIKKAEHQRLDAFELWYWRRLLRFSWTARSTNQSILKEISPEYSLEGLILKLKLQILWPLDVKNWLIRKDPDAGKDWRQEKKGTQQRMRWLDAIRWTWVWASSGSCWWTGKPGVLQSTGSQRVGHNWVTELNWIEGEERHDSSYFSKVSLSLIFKL